MPPIRLEIERRPSDFERDGTVTAFTGSCCCCCCCLHWIGAGVGAVVGMQRGWKSATEKRGHPLDYPSRDTLMKALVGSTVLTVAIVAVAIGLGFDGWSGGLLMVLAIAPPVAVVPVGLTMTLASLRLRHRMLQDFRREAKKLPARDGSDTSLSVYRMKLSAPPKTKGSLQQFSVFCKECWAELDESLHLPECPECSKPIVAPVISGPDFGLSFAIQAGGRSFLYATAGTALGYFIMWLISLAL